ncbi:MAG TPA: hypothetical protein VGK94_08485 [Candidatus Polarisedimenticolia bacterium]|jgi:hypothetical protein
MIPDSLKQQIRSWAAGSGLSRDAALHQLAMVLEPGAAVLMAPAGHPILKLTDERGRALGGPLSTKEKTEADDLTRLALRGDLDEPGQRRLVMLLDKIEAVRGGAA